ncbi:glycosyltransferase family 2 protein, partial [Candidatus Roizmanbacteria bacterium]|nr:glycosyltransferase family 2 protein [Candidatus Roizmanbacteria bacterium]
DEILVVDNGSVDHTLEVAIRYGAKIYTSLSPDFGVRKQLALSKATGKWVLCLDSDEALVPGLGREILRTISADKQCQTAYEIYFQNHLFGKPLHYGGETYSKLTFFPKNAVHMDPTLLHETFVPNKGIDVKKLHNKALHYSYQSLPQMFRKFTDYGVRAARMNRANGESVNLKKLVLYPLHMVWARYIVDKGYRDGLGRIILDLGFGYMEFLSYFLMLFISKQTHEYRN